jgi:sulfite reductase alpha subunit-like flavoprotein
MAQNLLPLPQPGFSVHPGYMATQPHTFISKEKSSTWTGKLSYTISYASPNAESIAPFLEISGDKKQVTFRDVQGRKVMSIAKRKHAMGWKPTTYHGLRSDGVELWVLTLDQGSLRGTEYGEL